MGLKVRARAETQRFLKFLVVGGLAFVVDTGALSVLVLLLSVDRTLAKGIAFVLAVLFSFAGNYFWTYRDSRSKSLRKQLAQFTAVSIGGLGINLLVFTTVQSAASRLWGPVPALYVGQVAAVGAAMIWNFLANRLITYSDVH
jgi:putative flippase GtrA